MQEVNGSIPFSSTMTKTIQLGGIAQLGEHLLCKQRVYGSIPYTSTSEYCGVIAQLGERLHGMQEVNGSIPFSSTMTFT